MATDLTGTPLSEAYVGFLHTGGVDPTASFAQVYTGDGNPVALKVSSTSLSVGGDLTVGSLTYPSTPGTIGTVLSINSSNNLEFKTVEQLLNIDPNSPAITGTFKSPTIVLANSRITSITSDTNPKRNVFIMPNRGSIASAPTDAAIISNIVWSSPNDGDIAIVMQKILSVTSANQLRGFSTLDIYEFRYSSTTGKWSRINSYN